MKVLALFVLVFLVFADDCGYFECSCNGEMNNLQTFDFYSDESRRAVSYVKNSQYFGSSTCEGDALYEVDSIYSLSYISELNNTHMYNRTITSNTLVLKSQEAIIELGCTGVSVGSSINLMNPEEYAKCDGEKLSRIVENFSNEILTLNISSINMNNPDFPQQLCVMTNVNNCYAVYPNRIILYIMYTSCVVIVVVVCVIYATIYKKKPTLPITQPDQTEVNPKVVDESKPEDNSSQEKTVAAALSPSGEVPASSEEQADSGNEEKPAVSSVPEVSS